MRVLFLIAITFSIDASAAFTEGCTISINRLACPGREEEAFAPYKGVNPTVQTIPFITEAQCQEQALKYAKIVRRYILKKIEVSVSYNGNSLPMKQAEGPCASTIKRGTRK